MDRKQPLPVNVFRDHQRRWSVATAIIYQPNGDLAERGGYFGACAIINARVPVEEGTTRLLLVSDYWEAQ